MPEPPKVNTEQRAIDAMVAKGVFPLDDFICGYDGRGHVIALYLYHGTVTDNTLRYLREFPHLEVLYLNHSAITDAGLQNLKGLHHLQVLTLDNTAVTDAGLKQLHEVPRLKQVSLDQTGVTQAGIAELQRALPNVEIVCY